MNEPTPPEQDDQHSDDVPPIGADGLAPDREREDDGAPLSDPLDGPPPAPPIEEADETAPIDPTEIERQASMSMDAIGADDGVMTEADIAAMLNITVEELRRTSISSLRPGSEAAAPAASAAGAPVEAQADVAPDPLLIRLQDGTTVDLRDPENQTVDRLSEILSMAMPLDEESLKALEVLRDESVGSEQIGHADMLTELLMQAVNARHDRKINLQPALAQAAREAMNRAQALHRLRERDQAAAAAGASSQGADRTALIGGDLRDDPADRPPSTATRDPQSDPTADGTPGSSAEGNVTGEPQRRGSAEIAAGNPIAQAMYNTGYSVVDSIRQFISGTRGPWAERNAMVKTTEAVEALKEVREKLVQYETMDDDQRRDTVTALTGKLSKLKSTVDGAVQSASELKHPALRNELLTKLKDAVGDVGMRADDVATKLTPEQRNAFGLEAGQLASQIGSMIASLMNRIMARLGLRPGAAPNSQSQSSGAPAASGASSGPSQMNMGGAAPAMS